jgi:hypothetical protein
MGVYILILAMNGLPCRDGWFPNGDTYAHSDGCMSAAHRFFSSLEECEAARPKILHDEGDSVKGMCVPYRPSEPTPQP